MTTTAITTATASTGTGTGTGTGTTVRALRPGDTGTVHRVFAQLSARSAFLRFHTGLPALTPVMAARLAAVAPGQHEVLVAERDGHPVALARWIRDPGDPAAVEVAVEVADAVQRQGIGGHLLLAVLASARAAGASVALAHVHPENGPVVRWLTRLGAERPSGPDEPFRLPLPVTETDRGSGPCGCMTACRSGCSDPSGWGPTAVAPRRSGVSVRGRFSPSSCRAAADPSPPRSSSTSCGVRTPGP
jgi:GNAT superfamily N-acetyltransferase